MTTVMTEAPIGRVEDELVLLAGQLSAGTCRWLLLLAEFDRREGWAGYGIRSCVHWLSIRLAISPSTSRAQLRVAHALSGLPAVIEEFAAGRLSYSQVRALCRVADATNSAELVELAQVMNAEQLERMCRLLRGIDDETEAAVADRTSLVTRWGDDGTATIRICLPAEDAAAVTAAVEERVKKMGLPAAIPWQARRAMALTELVANGASAASPTGRSSGSSSTSKASRSRSGPRPGCRRRGSGGRWSARRPGVHLPRMRQACGGDPSHRPLGRRPAHRRRDPDQPVRLPPPGPPPRAVPDRPRPGRRPRPLHPARRRRHPPRAGCHHGDSIGRARGVPGPARHRPVHLGRQPTARSRAHAAH